ncbi:aminoglycoside phosphotransferase family protein [Bdellovibrio bacteriovorus]|uniref:aminoglycoside phosphotransferase family protein n=1 Tax=Bdellovibrio bacteriovorus TaxID=959 RepID=UPI0035A720BB
MNFPAPFVKNIRDTFGIAGEEWLQGLPSLLRGLCERWDLTITGHAEDLSYNFVGYARTNAQKNPVVLKVLCPDGILDKELQWLKYYSEVTPAVLAVESDQRAFMMQMVSPGSSLKSLVKAGKDGEATSVIAQMIRSLGKERPAGTLPYKHVRDFLPTLSLLHGKLSSELVLLVAVLYDELCMTAPRDVLLHGDLHHDNILASADGWKVIDPHGYVGDPAFEVGAMISNPLDCYPSGQPLEKILDQRLDILYRELAMDPYRILGWTFCYSMLSAAWSIEDRQEVPENLLQIVRILGSKITS